MASKKKILIPWEGDNWRKLSDAELEDEVIRCFDPWYFLNYVKTQDERQKKVRPFPKWDYIKTWVERFESGRNTIDNKGRQMLWSWTAAAFTLHEMMHHSNTHVLYISMALRYAQYFKRRAKFIWKNLPEFLQPTLTGDNLTMLEFGKLNSMATFLACGENEGSGFTGTRLFADEFAKWRWPETYTAIAQTVDTINIGSTPVGIGNLFHEMSTDPKDMLYLETPYDRHPERDEAWKQKTMREKNLSEEQFAQEYECSFYTMKGLVYKSYSDAHRINKDPAQGVIREWVSGVDWGWRNPSCVLLGGRDGDGRFYVLREFYEAMAPTERIYAWCVEACRELGANVNDVDFYCDSADQNRIDEFIGCGANAMNADKRVTVGIQEVNGALRVQEDGRPRMFVRADKCPNLDKELKTYHYGQRRGDSGPKEVPVARDDHSVDAVRYLVMCDEAAGFVQLRAI